MEAKKKNAKQSGVSGKETKKNAINATKESTENKALNLFAEMMISKIESVNNDWSKPWFTTGARCWPKNLAGRPYNGMNALMLIMHCEIKHYDIPRFCTFDCVQRMNVDAVNDKGEPLPKVLINKGEKSFPVLLTVFCCVNKATGERIKYNDWKNLSEAERDNYNVYPKLQTYRVFNVAQTNLKEARPEFWAKLEKQYRPGAASSKEEQEQYTFDAVDDMMRNHLWICPITQRYGDEAYYSIKDNSITVPKKEQFKDGELFYGSLFHEMAHSTGHESQLGRIKPGIFGSAVYAKEELTAELTAALVLLNYGIEKHIKEDSAAYLKSWLSSLKEEPSFIKTVLFDVKKASALMISKIDECVECAVEA